MFMETIKIVVDFGGRLYTEKHSFSRSEIKEINFYLPAQLKEKIINGNRRKLKTQETLILNHLTGSAGERILNDFLKDRGYKVSERGSFKVFSDAGDMEAEKAGGRAYLIECKTCRDHRNGLRIRVKQLIKYDRYHKEYGINTLFFGVFLRLDAIREESNALILGDAATVYYYHVRQIRNITPFIKQRYRRNKTTFCLMPHVLRRGRYKVRTPEYFKEK